MIVRKFQWIILLTLHVMHVSAQDAKSYDTNDWVPITPSSADNTKKAEGRVLNLDPPTQNYFPENEYARKRSQPQQFLRETSFQKIPNLRPPKPSQPYVFEPVLPYQQPPNQYVPQNEYVQEPIPPVLVPPAQQLPYIQPPVIQPVPVPRLEQIPSQQLVAPPQNTQNYYDTSKTQFETIQNQKHVQNVEPIQLTTVRSKPKEEKETVQLLYVPLENLKQTQQTVTQPSPVVQVQTEVPRREKQITRTQTPKQTVQNHLTPNMQQDFISQALAAHKLQLQLQQGEQIVLQPSTTPQPKKRKPNQPPLSVYMEKQGPADVKDVLEVLKHAKTISVQDNIGPDSPQVFVGPSNLDPDGYAKFPLPYLSNVQGNRIERKVEQLPFFVAPLSYKTPDGYSKIPLPSPHVGSVVISNKNQLHEKHSEPSRQPQAAQNHIVQDFDVKQPFAYRDEPRPYLGNQQEQQPGGLLGLENEFLAGFPRNPNPNYELSPARGFGDYPNYQQNPGAQDYQLGLRDSAPQYYEDQPEQKPVRNNYQINDREVPDKDTKDLVQEYEIPSVPVESKTTFVPEYRDDKAQSNQYSSTAQPSFASPKTVSSYSFNEQPVRSTTTTTSTTTEPAPVVRQQYKAVQNPEVSYTEQSYTPRGRDPYRQIINQYEIEQINRQLGEAPIRETVRSTSAAPVKSTETYVDYDISTTARSRSRSRQRGRPTTSTTTTTTAPRVVTDDKFTVLEEFPVQPKTTTVKYTTLVETIPAKVYKLEPEQVAPAPVQTQAPLSAHLLNQEMLDQRVLHQPVPSLNQEIFNQRVRPNVEEQPAQIENVQDPQQPIPIYQRPQPSQDQDHVSDQFNPYLPGLINNLQNQAIRPLLIPNLLVPTTEKLATVQEEVIRVTTTTTTEAPRVETTTQRRSRGRQRANSRTTTTSAPRRTAGRRRTNHTRPTTERQYARTTTEATQTYDPTRRNSRQRVRTRGRPTTKEQPATERVLQTTETVFKQPILEGGFQASSGDPQSYIPFDVIQNQQVVTIKPEQAAEEKPLREYQPVKEYHQVYSLPPQTPSTERVIEEVVPSAKPVVDVQVSQGVTDRIQERVIATTPNDDSRFARVNGNIRSGGVIHNNKNDEASTRAPTRTRGRIRTRPRISSTTARPATTTTTTSKPQEAEEEEFYGFIRQPNFQKPAPVYSTTQQPLPVYSASYEQSPQMVIQLEEDASLVQDTDSASAAPVQFVGQIRPKYTTTEAAEPSTEAPKVRSRTRGRPQAKKTTPQAYNEVKSQRFDDQVTRRSSNVVRSRSRGKTHFKVPETVSVKPDEHDVEGGNYPVPYLKGKELTTDKPTGFQITVDPVDDEFGDQDQVPHSSLYSPQIVRHPDAWVEASILPAPNALDTVDKQMLVATAVEQTTVPEEEIVDVTTMQSEETTTVKQIKNGKRRGVWKLVKHRPLDGFETAESQNYYSVLNAFDAIAKGNNVDSPKNSTVVPETTTITTTTTTTTEKSIFDSLYNLLGMASKASEASAGSTKIIIQKEDVTTTTVAPTFPDEITEGTTTDEADEGTTIVPETTTTTVTEETASAKSFEVEPWQMRAVKTSTSTEVSHQTEICYKGKCIKSREEKTNA